jgi:hypothetical protein
MREPRGGITLSELQSYIEDCVRLEIRRGQTVDVPQLAKSVQLVFPEHALETITLLVSAAVTAHLGQQTGDERAAS